MQMYNIKNLAKLWIFKQSEIKIKIVSAPPPEKVLCLYTSNLCISILYH